VLNKHFLLLHNIFVETVMHFFLEEQHLFDIEMIYVFTVSLDQFIIFAEYKS